MTRRAAEPRAQASRMTADERRDAVVIAALTEFADGGYSGTSTESIATRAGVSQPYLFQLFGTKRELFLAVVRHGFDRTRLAFEDAARKAVLPDAEPCSILDHLGMAYMRLLEDRTLLRVQLQAYAACDDPDVRSVVRAEFGRLYAAVRALSGATEKDLHHFFAEGMLLNVAAALELGGDPATWSLGGLIGPRGGAA